VNRELCCLKANVYAAGAEKDLSCLDDPLGTGTYAMPHAMGTGRKKPSPNVVPGLFYKKIVLGNGSRP
jgi:hypothetical protein